MFPTQGQVEEYLHSITDYVHSIPATLPNFAEIAERVVEDIRRFGPLPSLQSVASHVPGLGAFEVPAPPPPPPPPLAAWYKGREWVIAAAVGTVGVGLAAGTVWRSKYRKNREKGDKLPQKREVVVVLGGDTVAGPALIRSLEKRGFVVITSVTTIEAADALEKRSKGYVKAISLNPRDPATVTSFIRSLQGALALRFPINAAGDPYLPSASVAHTNIVISLVSLLSLTPPPPPTPLERLDLSQTYLPTLYESHLTPLSIIQATLPLFRIASTRQGREGRTTIVVAVPAVASRVGVAFDGAKSMAIAGLVKGIEVLRREVGDDPKFVLIDVGSLAADPQEGVNQQEETKPLDFVALTRAWSPAERQVYGPAYEAAVGRAIEYYPQSTGEKRSLRRRTPEDVEVFVNAVVDVVKFGRGWIHPPREWLKLIRTWIRGKRFGVGAGAYTYTLASFLPGVLLDALLNLPGWLVALRARLLPLPPPPIHHDVPSTLKVPIRQTRLIENINDEKSLSAKSSRPASANSIEGYEGAENTSGMSSSLLSEASSADSKARSNQIEASWVSVGPEENH